MRFERADDNAAAGGDEGRLVVVSNRLPFTLKRDDAGHWTSARGAGGLVAAMDPLLKRSGGIWVGWPGESSPADTPGRQKAIDEQVRNGFRVVELPEELVAGFYEGFSNETIWPLFHHFPFLLKFDPQHWADYQAANARFRDALLEQLQPNDLIWVHDYQLMLLPAMLRAARPDVRVGFFLHIPFPPSAVFRLLPRGDELLQGLLGADFLAFHTHTDLQHFRNSIQRSLGLASTMDRVDMPGRAARLEALPISIDPKAFSSLLHEPGEMADRLKSLRAQYAGRHMLVAVDRLDYTKGIPERLRTFRRLLRDYPALRGKVVLIQVAVPSRGTVSSYQDLGHETDELAGQINGEFGTPEWTPLVYIKRGVPQRELAALYACADVAWVAPLRDGMNLVAKEYVACKEGGDGVLLLSEFAGAAAEMGEALQVNPYDEERSAQTVARALEMPEPERRQRMGVMYQRLLRNDVFEWGKRFLEGLRRAVAERDASGEACPPLLDLEELSAAWAQSTRRLVLLDYDGTLVPFASRPQDAAPPPKLLRRLTDLAADGQNIVAIVSGRSRVDLERWFDEVPGLWLAAEHGALLRSPGADWEAARPVDPETWKPRVRAILEHFADRTPGTFVEEKEFALVWHYRTADPDVGEWVANELIATLDPALSQTELTAQRGNKIVEVKLAAANKGEVLARIRNVAEGADFMLFAGDDRTDEDLFARLPDSAWTIHVGDRPSRARFRVPAPAQVHEALDRLAALAPDGSTAVELQA